MEPAFGHDGTTYLLAGMRDSDGNYQQSLVALDAAGNLKPGWPIDEPAGSNFGSLAVGPDGSVFVGECAGRDVGCVLHRLGTDGRELPGWPSHLPEDLVCPAGSYCLNGLSFGPDGTGYLSHWRDQGGLEVVAINLSGEIIPGWPVAPDANGMWWSNVQIGADGTLFLLGMPDGSDSSTRLAAFGRDGSPRPGWPVPLPDRSDYILGPGGIVIAWSWIDNHGELCLEPRRTLFTVLGPDGRTLPGWPRGSQGYASSPVVDVDGTVYYVSALGNVYAHARTGEVMPGWPVAVPRAIGWCGRLSPYLAPDGTIYVLGYDEMSDLPGAEVTALAQDGLSRPGWPYRPVGELVGPPFDSEGGGTISPPVFGPDGTVYLVMFHGAAEAVWAEVVALDRGGQVKAGWPYQLPIDPTVRDVASLTVAPDGRLFIRGGGILLALDPDGTLAE